MSPADWINDSHYELVYYQEVALKSQPGCQSFSPPQYYSQLITEMEILGWDKYDVSSGLVLFSTCIPLCSLIIAYRTNPLHYCKDINGTYFRQLFMKTSCHISHFVTEEANVVSVSHVSSCDFTRLLIFHFLLMSKDIIMILANANWSNWRPTLKFNGEM